MVEAREIRNSLTRLSIAVYTDTTGRVYELEPRALLDDYKIVLNNCMWEAKRGDLLEEDSVKELEKWAEEIAIEYKKEKFSKQSKMYDLNNNLTAINLNDYSFPNSTNFDDLLR